MLNSFVQIETLALCKMDRMMQLVRSGLRLIDQNVVVRKSIENHTNS